MKVTPSPLVADMSGATADLVAAKWKGRLYVRTRVIPKNPRTPLQTAQRDAMTEVVALWKLINGIMHDAYQLGANQLQISGFNDWAKLNVVAMRDETGLFGPRRNLEYEGDYIEIPNDFAYSDEPGPGQSNWTWTDPGQGALYHYGVIVYNATDNVLILADPDVGSMADAAKVLATEGVGDVFLVAFFVYRTDDHEMVHFGTGTHTQAT